MPNDSQTFDWISMTNKDEKSCKQASCDCVTFYEIHQQTAIKLLSNQIKGSHYKLEPGYEARARRIAAIYARIFLETLVLDDKANPKKSVQFGSANLRGRFYWMGLGAFASKTVAMVFGAWRTTGAYAFDWIAEFYSILTTKEKAHVQHSINTLAKGNLWLAMDIIPWHLAWAQDKAAFEKCMSSRDFAGFKNLKPAIDSLPWSGSVPTTINQLRKTNEIDIAFNQHLTKIEDIFNDSRNKTQDARFKAAATSLLAHLKQIAIQEQKNILQKICWDDPKLRQNVRLQRERKSIEALSLNTTLILSRDYWLSDIENARKDKNRHASSISKDPWSTPPEGTKVEDYDSRMKWILEGAVPLYHKLMMKQKDRDFLISELTIIAGWVNDRTGVPKFFMSEQSNDGKK